MGRGAGASLVRMWSTGIVMAVLGRLDALTD